MRLFSAQVVGHGRLKQIDNFIQLVAGLSHNAISCHKASDLTVYIVFITIDPLHPKPSKATSLIQFEKINASTLIRFGHIFSPGKNNQSVVIFIVFRLYH